MVVRITRGSALSRFALVTIVGFPIWRWQLPKVKHICELCGSEFEEWAYRKPRFCSRPCNYGFKRLHGSQLTHNFNRFRFDRWSPDMAYLLGFIFADGHLRQGLAGLEFGFGGKSDLTSVIRELMGSDGSVIEDTYKGSRRSRLLFYDKRMCQRVRDLGVPVGHKSDRIELPDIPDRFMRHFVRGYFDGDGTSSKRTVMFCSSSEGFLVGVGSWLDCRRCMTKLQAYPGGPNRYRGRSFLTRPYYRLQCTGYSNLRRLFQLLYCDVPAGHYSHRKRDAFERNACIPSHPNFWDGVRKELSKGCEPPPF